MDTDRIYDSVILGGGPAGYTAALYCARAGLDVITAEKYSAGGQMTRTAQIDNYPGFDEGIDGFELGEKMKRGAERFGAQTIRSEVKSVSLKEPIKLVRTDEGLLKAKTVIIALGADYRKLGVPREEELTGRGVGYCAACDGMFYRSKTAAVVGGGNSAASSALILSRICSRVILIHRRGELKADEVYRRALQQAGNVEFVWNSTVEALNGADKLEGVTVRQADGQTRDIECQGLFVCVGRMPSSGLLVGQIELDKAGYIIADETTRTNIPGVFAAGDIRTKDVRQIVTAAADGAAAAHFAEKYIADSN